MLMNFTTEYSQYCDEHNVTIMCLWYDFLSCQKGFDKPFRVLDVERVFYMGFWCCPIKNRCCDCRKTNPDSLFSVLTMFSKHVLD